MKPDFPVMPEHSQNCLPDGSMDGAGLPVMSEHLQDLLPDGSMNGARLPVMPEHLQDLLPDGSMNGARLLCDARTFTELPTRWQYGWSQTSL